MPSPALRGTNVIVILRPIAPLAFPRYLSFEETCVPTGMNVDTLTRSRRLRVILWSLFKINQYVKLKWLRYEIWVVMALALILGGG